MEPGEHRVSVYNQQTLSVSLAIFTFYTGSYDNLREKGHDYEWRQSIYL